MLKFSEFCIVLAIVQMQQLFCAEGSQILWNEPSLKGKKVAGKFCVHSNDLCTLVQNDVVLSQEDKRLQTLVTCGISKRATKMFVLLFSLLGLGSCVPFLGFGSFMPLRSQDESLEEPPVACVVHGTCYQGK